MQSIQDCIFIRMLFLVPTPALPGSGDVGIISACTSTPYFYTIFCKYCAKCKPEKVEQTGILAF
jgi:hypothetical protein